MQLENNVAVCLCLLSDVDMVVRDAQGGVSVYNVESNKHRVLLSGSSFVSIPNWPLLLSRDCRHLVRFHRNITRKQIVKTTVIREVYCENVYVRGPYMENGIFYLNNLFTLTRSTSMHFVGLIRKFYHAQ